MSHYETLDVHESTSLNITGESCGSVLRAWYLREGRCREGSCERRPALLRNTVIDAPNLTATLRHLRALLNYLFHSSQDGLVSAIPARRLCDTHLCLASSMNV